MSPQASPNPEITREIEEQRRLALLSKNADEADEELNMLEKAKNLTPSEISGLLHWLVKREIVLSERLDRMARELEALKKA